MAPAPLYFLRMEDNDISKQSLLYKPREVWLQAVATSFQRWQHQTIPSPSHTSHFTQSYTTHHDATQYAKQQYTTHHNALGWFNGSKCTVKILELSFPTFLNADLVCFCLLQFYTRRE